MSTFGNRRLIGDEAAEGGRHQGLFDGSLAGEFEVDAVEAWAVTRGDGGGTQRGNGQGERRIWITKGRRSSRGWWVGGEDDVGLGK